MTNLQAAIALLSDDTSRDAIASRARRAMTLSKTTKCGYKFKLAQRDCEALGLNPSYSIFFYVNADAVSVRAVLDVEDLDVEDTDVAFISACACHDRSDPNAEDYAHSFPVSAALRLLETAFARDLALTRALADA